MINKGWLAAGFGLAALTGCAVEPAGPGYYGAAPVVAPEYGYGYGYQPVEPLVVAPPIYGYGGYGYGYRGYELREHFAPRAYGYPHREEFRGPRAPEFHGRGGHGLGPHRP